MHPLHRLGYSKTTGIYCQAWQSTAKEADGDTSNAFLTSSAGDTLARKLTFMARMGQLNNGNFRYKAKLAATPACVLCSAPMDDTSHTLSGCKHMSNMVTARHNEAGGMIYRAIKKGRYGASIVAHDIGRRNAAADGDDTTVTDDDNVGRTIPSWVYFDSSRLSPAEWGAFRPDILLAMDTLDTRYICIVEIKYCHDTRRDDQAQRAKDQHAALERALRDAMKFYDHVHTHVITLGMMGTIYSDFHETMEALGVDKAASRKLARKLHMHAVDYVKKISCTKWHQEQIKRQGVG
jgi:hypothetical protein